MSLSESNTTNTIMTYKSVSDKEINILNKNGTGQTYFAGRQMTSASLQSDYFLTLASFFFCFIQSLNDELN